VHRRSSELAIVPVCLAAAMTHCARAKNENINRQMTRFVREVPFYQEREHHTSWTERLAIVAVEIRLDDEPFPPLLLGLTVFSRMP